MYQLLYNKALNQIAVLEKQMKEQMVKEKEKVLVDVSNHLHYYIPVGITGGAAEG